MKKLKVALIYDHLGLYLGGGEVVLLSLAKFLAKYRETSLDIYIGCLRECKTSLDFIARLENVSRRVKIKVITRVNQKLFQYFISYFYSKIDTSKYDKIIYYTAFLAHTAFNINCRGESIVYFNTPSRFIWNLPISNSIIKRVLPEKLFDYLKENFRIKDYLALRNVDKIFVISQAVKERVKAFYNLDSTVIYPSIAKPIFLSTDKETYFTYKMPYYAFVSRLEKYKNAELLLRTWFKYAMEEQLFIIGIGPEYSKLINLASMISKFKPRNRYLDTLNLTVTEVKNICFTGYINSKSKNSCLKFAKASFALNDEDLGLTKIESLSCGCPVIAYNKGGNCEIIEDGKNGVLFDELSEESLFNSIKISDRIKFDREKLKSIYSNFSEESFFKRCQDTLMQSS